MSPKFPQTTKDYLIQFVFLLGVFVFPFIFWPWTSIAFEVPKVWFFWLWIELLWLGSMLFQFKSISAQINIKLFGLALLFLGWVSVSSILGIDLFKSIWGNPYRFDGIFTLIHLVSLAIWVAWFLPIKTWGYRFFQTIVIANTMLAILAIMEWIVCKSLGICWTQRYFAAVGSTFGQPNYLAGYLLVGLPGLWVTYKQTSSEKFLIYLSLLLQLIAILLTQSWGSMLGIAMILPVMFFIYQKKLGLTWITLVVGLLIFGFVNYLVFQQDFNAESRVRIWHKLAAAIQSRPGTGWGWANVDYAYQDTDWPLPILHDVYVDKAHSALLEIVVTTGVPGLILYLIMLGLIFQNLFKKVGHSSSLRHFWIGLTVCFSLYVYHSQTNVISINEELWFWVILGWVGQASDVTGLTFE